MKTFVKSVYQLIPFKSYLFLFLRKVWHPAESVFKHLPFTGVFKVSVGEGKSFKLQHYGYMIENEIFWAGLENGWEKESIGLWLKLCKKATYILDLGANTGIYSLIAKAVNPHSKVFAFEPVERVFKKLEHNLHLNRYDVTCVRKAVSNKDGKAIIYDPQSDHVLSVTVNHNYQDASVKVKEVEIDTITLNSYFSENNIPRIDLIKIDVETHEPEVLEGFSNYLAIYKPPMLIEILNDEIGARVENLLSGLGYLYFNINENTGIRKVDRIVKSDYFNYFLCNEEVAREMQLIA